MREILLLFSLVLLFYFRGKTQPYQPMAVEGAHWIISWYQGEYPPLYIEEMYTFTLRGDTIVDDKWYKKLYWEFFAFDEENLSFGFPFHVESSSLIGLMRDDTLARKVYYLPYSKINPDCPDEEYVLFDFSVEQGDTLDWCSLESLKLDDDTLFIVDSITVDSNSYYGQVSRKIIHTFGYFPFSYGLQSQNPQQIIEGVGYEYYGWFIRGGEFSASYCVGTDAECNIVTSTKNFSIPRMRVFPNPVRTELYFSNLHLFPSTTTVHVFDMLGQVKYVGFIKNSILDFSLYENGIYVVQLQNSGKIIGMQRVIKY